LEYQLVSAMRKEVFNAEKVELKMELRVINSNEVCFLFCSGIFHKNFSSLYFLVLNGRKLFANSNEKFVSNE
jgi:hypothetical protein